MPKKAYSPESQDVTEPLPGMMDPISRARQDRVSRDLNERAMKSRTKTLADYGPAGLGDETGPLETRDLRKKVMKKAKGGKVSSASKRADGCAIRGKTRGRMV